MLKSRLNTNKPLLLKVLYEVDPDAFLQCFVKNWFVGLQKVQFLVYIQPKWGAANPWFYGIFWGVVKSPNEGRVFFGFCQFFVQFAQTLILSYFVDRKCDCMSSPTADIQCGIEVWKISLYMSGRGYPAPTNKMLGTCISAKHVLVLIRVANGCTISQLSSFRLVAVLLFWRHRH